MIAQGDATGTTPALTERDPFHGSDRLQPTTPATFSQQHHGTGPRRRPTGRRPGDFSTGRYRVNQLTNFLAGGAILGLIAGFWDKIKAVLWKAVNLFVQQVEIPSESAHDAVISHLIARYPRSRLYDRMYGASYEHHRD